MFIMTKKCSPHEGTLIFHIVFDNRGLLSAVRSQEASRTSQRENIYTQMT